MSDTDAIDRTDALRLYIGGRDTGVAIIPWLLDPRLRCVRWADGLLSPPANITRAKEAAIMFARHHFGWGSVHRWGP
jgi:hypothetical protein